LSSLPIVLTGDRETPLKVEILHCVAVDLA